MNKEDDFFCEEVNSNSDEIILEQRSTERLKSQIKATGYRDGIQKFMENETHLQLGFDLAYSFFARIGFFVGQFRSLGTYLDSCKKDSVFLTQLYDKLEKIENNNYELFLIWSDERKLNANNLDIYLKNLEIKIFKLKEYVFNSSSDCDFKSNILLALNEFQIKDTEKVDDSVGFLNFQERLNI